MQMLDRSPNWQNPWIVANWKMNPASRSDVIALLDQLANQWSVTNRLSHCNVVLAPSMLHIDTVNQLRHQHALPVALAAQNLCAQSADKGAFTGEISAAQLADSQVNYVIIGHSERRQYFGEDDNCLIAKIRCALSQNLTVILCIGETQQQYEAGQTHSVISEQLTVLQTLVETGELNQSRFIIAYEPVWAIGTGKVPTPAEVENVHTFIQSQLTNIHHTLHHTPILYGGSVKADNAKDIAQCPTVSGVLVGGAALDASSFTQIIQAFAKK